MPTVDLGTTPLRALNAALHRLGPDTNQTHWQVLNPDGRHAVAVGLDAPVTVEIEGHVGYYCAGMNKAATCAHCRAALAEADQVLHARYDKIELPPVRPVATRVERYLGHRPCCGGATLAPVLEGWSRARHSASRSWRWRSTCASPTPSATGG